MRHIGKALLVTIFVASCSSVLAAGLGDLTKIFDTFKQVQQIGGSAGVVVPTPFSGTGSVGNRIEPDWLITYPRAELKGQYVNPLERVSIPLTMPTTANATATKYMVPMEGKVTMLQYRHPGDDSPLQIQRHYDALLAQQDFERIIVCSTPCPFSGGGSYWMRVLDPGKAVNYSDFPDAPTYLIGYKQNAMAVVAIGKYYAGNAYMTFIKLVEGNILDRRDLDAYIASLKPKLIPQPATPALQAQATQAQATQAQAQIQAKAPLNIDKNTPDSLVESIPAARISGVIRQTKGLLVVHLTSRDAGCPYCVAANPRFDEFSKRLPDVARYVRVTWEPYGKAFEDMFVRNYGVAGMPTYLVFLDGQVVKRANGNVTHETLEQLLKTAGSH